MVQFEEFRLVSSFWSWVIVVGLALGILAVGGVVWLAIPENERYWDFGALPDVPAQSVYSTSPPPDSQPVGRQLPAMPEAQPPAAGGGR
jgi:hypothetical protein